MRTSPADFSPTHKACAEFLEAGRYVDAEGLARTLCQQNPLDENALQFLSQALFQQQRYTDVLPLAQQLLELNPTHIGYGNNYLIVLLLLEKWVEAEAACRMVLAFHAEHHAVRLNLAEALFRQNRPFDALAELEEISVRAPDFTEHLALQHAIESAGFRLARAGENTGLRLNLGCGRSKIKGFINVDSAAACEPDLLLNLEQTPWPWPDNSVSDVQLIHVLEHLGKNTDTFLAIIKELYRVCQHEASVHIIVPHPRSDAFLSDPTHVRPIMPGTLALFDRQKNHEWHTQGISNTPLALILGVDFVTQSVFYRPSPEWQQKCDSGELSEAQMTQAIRQYNNVVDSIDIFLQVRKPL